MKKPGRTYLHYLDDIVVSMRRIAEYVAGHTYDSFVADYKTTDAVIRNFEVIGEAAKKLPDEVKVKYDRVPWEEMYRLRNRAIHEYFGVDFEIIWSIAVDYLPQNYEDVKYILDEENK